MQREKNQKLKNIHERMAALSSRVERLINKPSSSYQASNIPRTIVQKPRQKENKVNLVTKTSEREHYKNNIQVNIQNNANSFSKMIQQIDDVSKKNSKHLNDINQNLKKLLDIMTNQSQSRKVQSHNSKQTQIKKHSPKQNQQIQLTNQNHKQNKQYDYLYQIKSSSQSEAYNMSEQEYQRCRNDDINWQKFGLQQLQIYNPQQITLERAKKQYIIPQYLSNIAKKSNKKTVILQDQGIGQGIFKKVCVSVQKLNLCHNWFRELMPISQKFPNLVHILVNKNMLSHISQQDVTIWRQNLTVLWASENKIKDVSGIALLYKIKDIDISKNYITQLPQFPQKFHQLRYLNLSNNRLIFLPESISNLYNLFVLNVSHNNLSQLPQSIANLTQLNRLQIKDNKLMQLPKIINKLRRLQHLCIRIQYPSGIANLIQTLPSLRYISLESYYPQNSQQIITIKAHQSQLPRKLKLKYRYIKQKRK